MFAVTLDVSSRDCDMINSCENVKKKKNKEMEEGGIFCIKHALPCVARCNISRLCLCVRVRMSVMRAGFCKLIAR